MVERIAFFDQEYGIGLGIVAGSGRSWMELPDGDPQHAHCRIDVPGDTLLASARRVQRPTSGTLFAAWDDVLRFADQLTALAAAGRVGEANLGDQIAWLKIETRSDDRLRAETAFTQGHHVTMTLRCQTLWDWHFGVREDLPALADRVRLAVSRARPRRTP